MGGQAGISRNRSRDHSPNMAAGRAETGDASHAASGSSPASGESPPGATQPLLIRIESKTGHGAGKPTAKTVVEVAGKPFFLV